MARWRPDARERLRQAALELFAEQGFAATTVPAITARAGLTTRTFFRHFADKREVLFADEAEISAFATELMATAPTDEPLTFIVAGLRTVAET
ncbi:helix-turn-helix domain-containing protein, partial [Micromonospora sp.]